MNVTKVLWSILCVLLFVCVGIAMMNDDNYLFGPTMDMYAVPTSIVIVAAIVISLVCWSVRLVLKAHRKAAEYD
jgi:putative effector of murein hydrolase LrgA (UPF0299 family)